MKRTCHVFMILGCVLNFGALARADNSVSRLPDDGWWIRYSYFEKQKVDGVVHEFREKVTYSLVGTTTEDGHKCRWVERNTVASLRDRENVACQKFLVSEKDLLERERPLEGLKRGWAKRGDADVRALTLGKNILASQPLLDIFPGVYQNSKRLGEERIVDYQQGRLMIPQARTQTITTPGENANQNWVVESIAWFDPITSPVLAAARIQIKDYDNDVVKAGKEVDMVIEDMGNDAKSKLPENN